MRERAEVMERFRELRAVRLKARKAEFLSKTPRNCKYNERLRVKGEGMCGFCQNPNVLAKIKSKVFVCNQEDMASRCRVFECRSTEESVEEMFEDMFGFNFSEGSIDRNRNSAGSYYRKIRDYPFGTVFAHYCDF